MAGQQPADALQDRAGLGAGRHARGVAPLVAPGWGVGRSLPRIYRLNNIISPQWASSPAPVEPTHSESYPRLRPRGVSVLSRRSDVREKTLAENQPAPPAASGGRRVAVVGA